MTICLAAYSHPHRTIVVVSDRMISLGDRSADNSTAKLFFIHGDWCVQFAGDMGIASRIAQRAALLLGSSLPHSAVAAGAALERAWADEQAAMVNAKAICSY